MNDEKKDPQPQLPPDLTLNPDGTATFVLNEEGEVSGTYKGVFTFRCFLNPLDTLAAGRQYRDLLGQFGAEASQTEKFTAFALSQLSKRIIKAPPFWNADASMAGNIPDANILSLALDRAITAEVAYKAKLAEKKSEALKTAESALEGIERSLKGNPEEDADPSEPEKKK